MARENKIKKKEQQMEHQATDSLFRRGEIATNPIDVADVYKEKVAADSQEITAVIEAKKKIAAYQDPELVRKTYYYTNQLIKAISLMAAVEEKDKSQVVRELLLDSRLKEYMK